MDLLWKSFFDKNAHYRPISEKAVQHPVDIQETDNGLKIEIAAVGLEKSEADLNKENYSRAMHKASSN